MEMLFGLTMMIIWQLSLVKAYIVPTGSMAPTVLGFHKNLVCPQCKIGFAVNAVSEGDNFPPAKVTGCTCTNCRLAIDFGRAKLTPQLQGGDRVMMVVASAKSLQRGDVAVHKYPPAWFDQKRSSVLWISRLMGLPGETLALQAGRLYVAADIKYKDEKVKPEELWQREHMHVDDPEALKRFKQGKFQIVRKSPAMMVAQRRLVYDHDFPAGDLPARWAGAKATAWKKVAAHGFQHDGQGAAIDWLTYRHLLRPDGPGQAMPHLIMDDFAYNTATTANRAFAADSNWVGDLLLECDVTIAKVTGELWLDLARGNDRFQARFDLTTGQCALFRLARNAKPQELASVKETPLSKAGSHRLRFANCADRVTLWIDDQLAFGDGVTYEPPAQKGPTMDDLEPARIGSHGASVKVHHMQLWRDPYYTHEGGPPDARGVDGHDPKTWGPLREPRVRTFYVQPAHYFFLSDNSPYSNDSRSWGVVPAQLLAGKLVLRYFPFERAGSIR